MSPLCHHIVNLLGHGAPFIVPHSLQTINNMNVTYSSPLPILVSVFNTPFHFYLQYYFHIIRGRSDVNFHYTVFNGLRIFEPHPSLPHSHILQWTPITAFTFPALEIVISQIVYASHL